MTIYCMTIAFHIRTPWLVHFKWVLGKQRNIHDVYCTCGFLFRSVYHIHMLSVRVNVYASANYLYSVANVPLLHIVYLLLYQPCLMSCAGHHPYIKTSNSRYSYQGSWNVLSSAAVFRSKWVQSMVSMFYMYLQQFDASTCIFLIIGMYWLHT